MSWKIKVTTDVGSLVHPLHGSYRTKRDAEKDAERARKLPGTVSAEVFDKKRRK